ncbi:CAP domain-containing protein [Candidatus Saccharibacteria bacterium]|nr:CAP domain-containing protein [Candidatus Saccharibacteria bacterium]
MAAAMLKQTRMTILLSLNAVAILIAGIIIASAIGLNSSSGFKVVDERSDEVDDTVEEVALIDPVEDVFEAISQNTGGYGGQEINYAASAMSASSFDTGPVPSGQLWNADSVTIYQTANIDICVNDTVGNLGDMYWQTSNPAVIAGFYSSARERLGYSTSRCRYPKIVGTGTTTITAGTYDGARRDTLTVTVVAPPIEQWKREVLNLVNAERAKVGLGALSWGSTCETGAQIRAQEIMSRYEHARPDGSSWDSVCKPMNGGAAGENLAAGNTTVSPETVVQTWMNSPTHRANILSDKFDRMAVGFVFDPNSQYKTYWSQFFSNY